VSCGTVEHCCYLGQAGVCPHLEENTVPGRRWACGLLVRLGSWDAVHASHEYQRDVAPAWQGFDPPMNCGTYPESGRTCGECGKVGS
jgi:hypothetical protein